MTNAMLWMLAGAALTICAAPGAIAAQAFETTVELHEIPPGSGQYHLAPDTIRVNEGDTVKVTVVNPADNTESHNLVFCSAAPCDLKTAWAFTPNIAPGNSTTVTFVANKAGDFEYYCTIPGHKTAGLGMQGTLEVVAAPPAKKTPWPDLLLPILGAAALLVRRR